MGCGSECCQLHSSGPHDRCGHLRSKGQEQCFHLLWRWAAPRPLLDGYRVQRAITHKRLDSGNARQPVRAVYDHYTHREGWLILWFTQGWLLILSLASMPPPVPPSRGGKGAGLPGIA